MEKGEGAERGGEGTHVILRQEVPFGFRGRTGCCCSQWRGRHGGVVRLGEEREAFHDRIGEERSIR